MSEFPGLVSGQRPVGVVSFAQYDNVRREDERVGHVKDISYFVAVGGAA